MNPRIIKTEAENEEALIRIDELMDFDPEIESEEGRELELLSVLVEQYEDRMYPVDLPDPVTAIKFRMEQGALRRVDLEQYIGSKGKVSEVLNRKKSLSLSMMRNLHKGLGISAEVLLQKSSAELPKVKFTSKSFPMAEMLKRKYFDWFSGSLNEAKEVGEELLNQFFEVFTEVEPKPVLCRSSRTTTDENALLAWQARACHLIKNEKLTAFDKNSISDDFIKSLSRLSYLENGPGAAIEFLNKKGIHVVLITHLPKTYLDGACFMAPEGNPVIGLTLRHDRLDNFWFTLFHELGHVLLHLDDSGEAFFDDTDKLGRTKNFREVEANDFAASSLISESDWNRVKSKLLRSPTEEKVLEFAEFLSIHPSLVAGRIRWQKDDYSLFPSLIGSKQLRKILDRAS